jgi:hypothetical protein
VLQCVADFKYGVGLNHLPSGHFGANAAWLALNVIAHNMSRFTVRLGGLDTPTNATAATADHHTGDTDTTTTNTTAPQTAATETAESAPQARKSFVATDTLRRHHLSIPGRITRSGRRERLHLPRDWPWADQFNHMLASLRSVKLAI